MTTRKAALLDKIYELLSIFYYSIEYNNSLNRLQQNIDAEDLICELLNIINNWSLINLNKVKQNYEAIDLGDYTNRVCVQVTSNKSRDKVQSTIHTFELYGYEKDFDRLVFVYLKNQKTKFSKPFSTNRLSFNEAEDIFDLKDLIKLISNLDENRIEKIHDFLNKEIIFNPALTSETVSVGYKLQTDIIKKKCIAKLKSLGLDDLVAWSVLTSSLEKIKVYVSDDSEGVRFLVGGFGSGKSHQLYCLYLKLAELYEQDNTMYFPIFFEAKNFISRNEYMTAFNNLEFNVNDKVCLLIDGLDEANIDVAQSMVEELELLSNCNEHMKIIVSSRPLTIINDKKQIQPPQLSLDEINELYCLINDVSNYNIQYRLGNNKNALLQTISKPFCAVLYCLYRKNHYLYNEMDFVKLFISKSVEKMVIKYPDCEKDIKNLAIKAIDYNLGNIDKSEVRSISLLNKLLLTGLFIEEDRGISFVLPITAQWLAAEALRDQVVLFDEILGDENRLVKWIYPLAILFNQMTFEESRVFYGKIVEKKPGIASIIAKIGVDLNYGTVNENKQFNAENLYYALSSWLDVFQFKHLSYYINGRLNTIYFNQDGNYITYAISNSYKGSNIEVRELSIHGNISDISYMKSCGILSQPTWPWVEALEYIGDAIIKKAIKERLFRMENSILEQEYIWSTCLKYLHTNGRVTDSIDIAAIKTKLDKNPKCDEIVLIGRGTIKYNDFTNSINKLISKGIERIDCPYERGSLPLGGFVWSQYTVDEMKSYIERVFTNALNEYKNLVEEFFPILKEQMGLYKFLPAKMEGFFKFEDHPIFGGPTIMWGIYPVDAKESLSELKNGNTSITTEFLKLMNAKVKNIDFDKPYMKYSVRSQRFDMGSETPVTDLVYEWLKEDLREIDMIKR